MSALVREDMTLLDIVAEYRGAEAVLRQYDDQAGRCLMCEHLFDTVADVARRYGFDCDVLLRELNNAAKDEGRA